MAPHSAWHRPQATNSASLSNGAGPLCRPREIAAPLDDFGRCVGLFRLLVKPLGSRDERGSRAFRSLQYSVAAAATHVPVFGAHLRLERRDPRGFRRPQFAGSSYAPLVAQFNDQQLAAVQCDGNLLIVAPPGSGKTGTLVGKAMRILRTDAARVGMVTFTRAAAAEMRTRVLAKRGQGQGQRVVAETFHRHALAQLRSLRIAPRLLEPRESKDLVISAMAQAGSCMPLEDAIAEIETQKALLTFNCRADGCESELVQAYQEMLRSRRAVDLMDVIRLAVEGMRSGRFPPLKVTHLLCDEMQDADAWQLEWCMTHAEAGAVTTLVGDDDQSLYSFRHALGYAGMIAFRDRCQANQVNLSINYRSRQEILLAGLAVIRNNSARIEKEMLCSKGTGGSVLRYNLGSAAEEAKVVADLIQVSPETRTWGVIARSNHALRNVASELRARGIPYTRKEDSDEEDPASLAMSRLLAALEQADTIMLEGALRAFGVGTRTLDEVRKQMGSNFGAILDGELPPMGGDPRFDPEDVSLLTKIATTYLKPWRDLLEAGQVNKVLDRVVHFIQRETRLVSEKITEDFEANVRRVRERKGSLKSRVSYMLMPARGVDRAGARVDLQTYHGSKGLEYDSVFLVRCNEGEVPSSKAEDLEEERRGFYVALTRARDELFLSCVRAAGEPSRFVSEIFEALPGVAGIGLAPIPGQLEVAAVA